MSDSTPFLPDGAGGLGEDAATLAAIDEGIRAADEGRVVSLDEVRKRIPLWTSGRSPGK